MTYFLKQGNSYTVSKKEALDLHEQLPAGNYVIKKNEMTGQLYLEAIDKFERPIEKVKDLLTDDCEDEEGWEDNEESEYTKLQVAKSAATSPEALALIDQKLMELNYQMWISFKMQNLQVTEELIIYGINYMQDMKKSQKIQFTKTLYNIESELLRMEIYQVILLNLRQRPELLKQYHCNHK